MKLKGESNCKAKFRNLGKGDGSELDGAFFLQVEYKESILSVVTVDEDGKVHDCLSF